MLDLVTPDSLSEDYVCFCVQVKPNMFQIGLGVLPANVFSTAPKWFDALESRQPLGGYLAHDALAAKAMQLFEQKQHNAAFTLTFKGILNEPIAALNYAAVYQQLVEDRDWDERWSLGWGHLRDWARLCR